MYDLNDLFYFAKVVEHGGFSPAGRALNVAKSNLSRRIRQLEERLDTHLIVRSTRVFHLTEIGQKFYEHCRAVLIEADSALEAVQKMRAEPCGTVRLSCPIGLLNFHVGEMLAEFMVRYPQVNIELDATNRRVDVLAEGYDLAIRVRALPLEDSELAYRVFASREQCIVAAPELLAQYATPTHPRLLPTLPTMARDTPNENHHWLLHNAQGESERVLFQPRYMTTDMLALKQAAIRGVGIVQLPVLMVQRELAAGRLISVLPDWRPRSEVIHCVFPSRRGMLPSVRALIDYLAAQYQTIVES